MRIPWIQPEDMLPYEFVQARSEGKPVDDVMERWTQAGGTAQPEVTGLSKEPVGPHLRELATELLDELDAREGPDQPGTFPDYEAAIQPGATGQPGDDYPDRVAGAWLGRAAGCVLGKPVEQIPRRGIEEILRTQGRWPLDAYFTGAGLPTSVAARWPWNAKCAHNALAENILGAPEDDDLNFTILALMLLEKHGPGFTTSDVAQLWLDALPAGAVFTAERAVYANLLRMVDADSAAATRNPYREWIGALIRADLFGWVRPGLPLEAAQLAWKDARLSHRGDGVAAAVWVAAMCSWSMVSADVNEVLDVGASFVPPGALAQAIHEGREAAGLGLARGLDRLYALYGGLHWVHVLNNAATIAFALQLGQGDFTASIAAAVTAGWDTDSVGACVGGIAGALAGSGGIGPAWTKPLAGRIATSLPGGTRRIDELVQRTLLQAR